MQTIPISHLIVISASSHCTLADVLPSFTTPSRVACLPVCLCTHRPPILNPPSTPPITANTGHTWWHSVRRCASDSSDAACRPLLPLSSSRSSSFSSCSSRLCAERLLRSLVAPAGEAPSRRQPLICWRRWRMLWLMVWVQRSERCKIRTSWVVASARTVATGLQIGSPGNRSRGVPLICMSQIFTCRVGNQLNSIENCRNCSNQYSFLCYDRFGSATSHSTAPQQKKSYFSSKCDFAV